MVSILHRVLDARGLRKMMPANLFQLGYPGPFPGAGQPEPQHQFDAIINHAVLDYDQFNRYLKPHPYWFTILREPVSRSISSFNYFAGNRPMTWSGMMDRLGGVKHVASQSQDTLLVARFGNSLAYDLGWYDFVGHHGGTAWDHDKGTIQAFVSQLDTQFDLVLLLEEIDKGLVLLGRAANIGIAELSYVSMTKTNHAVYPFGSRDAKVYPTSTEHGQLEGFLSVDMAIYKHFKSKFDEVWEARVTADHSLMDDLTLLQCMNQALADACHAPVTSDTKPSPTCHIAYLTDEVPYGLKFQSHGGTRAFAPEP